MNITHKTIKIRAGMYVYRGYIIHCCGYHSPDHKVVWEAIDEFGGGFAHHYSLKGVKKLINQSLNKK